MNDQPVVEEIFLCYDSIHRFDDFWNNDAIYDRRQR